MKTVTAIILTALLAACSGSDDATVSTTPAPAPTIVAVAEPEPVYDGCNPRAGEAYNCQVGPILSVVCADDPTKRCPPPQDTPISLPVTPPEEAPVTVIEPPSYLCNGTPINILDIVELCR